MSEFAMKTLRQIMMSAVALGTLAIAAPSSATELFDLIDPPTLDLFHTEHF